MEVALFIPCYIDQLYPNVAVATLELLQKLGCSVSYPLQQTCCGQPLANSGFYSLSNKCNENFINNFSDAGYIVCPSGSCTLHVKEHLQSKTRQSKAEKIKSHIYELSEFITDVLKPKNLTASFPYKVGFLTSCHGQRGLHLSSMSEINEPSFSKPLQLLNEVAGIDLFMPQRVDDCCGFGGTFCVYEEAASVKMGKDRIRDFETNNVDYITGYDVSCLMHLEGILKRNKSRVKTIHIAEILNSGTNG